MSLNVELLEQSFELVKPRANEFAASFYENLFALYPEAKILFTSTDMKKQQKKLFTALVLVVENLRRPVALEAVLLDLGFRHINYGTLPEHYALVGDALLKTFEQYLQQDWTPEVKQAWADAYDGITQIMCQGARYSREAIASAAAVVAEKEVEASAIPEQEEKPPIPAALKKAASEKPPASGSNSRELKVELIQSSFEKIKPRGAEFAASFYQNLFESYPEAKPLFAKTEMASQEKKLLNSLVMVVEGLRQPEALAGVLRDLGARHLNYGTLRQHYPLVTKTLVTTLEYYLQEDWTPELKTAWVYAFGQITKLMFEGAGYIETTAPPPEKVETSNKKELSGVKRSPVQQTARVLDREPQTTETSSDDSQRIKIKETLEKILDYLRELPKGSMAIGSEKVNIKEIPGRIIDYLRELPKASMTIGSEEVNIKEIPGKILDYFWELPKWVILLGVTAILILLVHVTDEESLLGETLGSADAISLVAVLVLYIKEIPERKKEFHYQAWSRIDAAEGLKNSQTRFLAMQDLNKDRVSLRRLRAPGANLEDIQLEKANLNEANLSEADLANANLKQANLSYADLSSAILSRANLSQANLNFSKLGKSNLSSADLTNANIAFADLTNANLSGANLTGARLTGATLQETYLVGANLKDAEVNIADLSSAYIKGAIMPDGSKHR